MVRALTLALALAATDAFVPGTTLRQRAAPMKMVADYLSTMKGSPAATGSAQPRAGDAEPSGSRSADGADDDAAPGGLRRRLSHGAGPA